MKPHPRIRKTIKWGGAAVTVLLVVVWIGSGWWRAGFSGAHGVVGFDNGGLVLHESLYVYIGIWDAPWYVFSHAPGWKWWFEYEFAAGYSMVFLPLWVLAVPSVVATSFAWRSDALARRRARIGLCPKCNYDRAGIAKGAKCPECGATPASR